MPSIDQALAVGLAHHQAGRLAHAEEIYREVLRQQPHHAEALHLLGLVAVQAGRRDEGIALIQRAVDADPTNSVYLGNLGSAYSSPGRYAEAQRALEAAIRCDPANADAHYHLGLVSEGTGRINEALDCYRRALALCPTLGSAHNNLGLLLRLQGKLDEALAHFGAALALNPEAPHIHYNRALVWLGQGRLAEGWHEYEWRLRCREFATRHFSQPVWDGTPRKRETLLVHAEQGLGDTIQFLRYLPLVRQRCPHVRVEVPPSLVSLCRHSGIEGLVDRSPHAAPPAFDFQIPLLSLPRVFGTTLSSIPADVPYLQTDDDLVAAWREKLAAYPGCKVGIAWQGRPSHREDRFRSLPLRSFAPLANVVDVRLVSLQKGTGLEQIAALGGLFPVVDLQSEVPEAADGLSHTAAIIKGLDLVITCDTSVAHLAGALGMPVWVALAAGPDWRWLAARPDSPWYPSMRLFRQTILGDWAPVFHEMADQLRARLEPARM